MSRDFLEQSQKNTTESVDSDVEVLHTFRRDCNDLLSYFLLLRLSTAHHVTVSAKIDENYETVPSARAFRINVGSW